MVIGRTLALYFSGRFLRTILSMFMSVFFLIWTLDFVELMRRAGDAPGATTRLMAQLALYRTPSVAEQILPFAILFGSMATLLLLSRKLELVIARSAGISAWQFLLPGLAVSALVGVVSVTLYNPISAELKQRAASLEASIFARFGKVASGKDLWLRQNGTDGQSIIRAASSLDGGKRLAQVTFISFEPSGAFRERAEAREATLHEGYWELREARVMSALEEPQSYDTFLIATNLEVEQVRQSFTPPEAVPFWELDTVIERTERAGLDATKYKLRQSSLLARPLLLIAMTLVAASVSLRFFRFGGVAKMVLAGVAAGFVLYVATELTGDLGSAGFLRPAVAAWLPAILGTALGVLALLHLEDG
jgi:lipopolysaccharide export system permease protein